MKSPDEVAPRRLVGQNVQRQVFAYEGNSNGSEVRHRDGAERDTLLGEPSTDSEPRTDRRQGGAEQASRTGEY